ncbi:MAG TPA: Asp-tRNA(Asn)/Glu-tRNA(Gln) amidotransferase subunit GatA [Planctomycetaceae bacterium]|nr:Asp-tRNA(Asn)/Glu-tRNA(Gln) amidotransferase subunit GatA [Planctomycetaceae bacterium]
MSLLQHSATDLLSLLQSGDVTSQQVVQAYSDRAATVEDQVHAILQPTWESALERAEEIDRRRSAGELLGSLAGLPVAVKDILCTDDFPTTCGSKILETFRPPYNATVIEKLRAADAILVGKTNLDEFAMGSSTENSAFGPTHNPWDLTRVPGGSSGGSAASVSADLAPLAIGTDTGGSIRQPAAFCGVTGLKPTYGRVSRYGLVAFASSLDQAGPFARSAQDTALLLDAISGHDARDSTSANRPPTSAFAEVEQPLESLRVGVIREQLGEGVDDEIRVAVEASLQAFQQMGASLIDVQLPHARYAVATYYIVAPCEASGNLARYDGAHYGLRVESPELGSMYSASRARGLGEEVKRRIMLGTFALSSGYNSRYYLKSLQVRRLIRNDYDQAFENVDLLLGPTTPTTAFRIGEKSDDPLSMYLGDLFTVGTNLAGISGLSIPCGFSAAGLPIGLHLQGPAFSETTLLRAAHMYQSVTDWHARRPPL